MREPRFSHEPPPAPAVPDEIPGLRGLLFVAVVVVVVSGLYFGRSMLIPITFAILLSFLLAPVVHLLQRLYLGRILSVLIAVLLALTVILALGGLIGTQMASLAEDVPIYALTIQRKVDSIQQFMLSRITRLTFDLGHEQRRGGARPKSIARSDGLTGNTTGEPRRPVEVEVLQPDMTAIELARRILTPVAEPLSTTAIVLIVSVFILLQREDLRDRMIRLFGSSDLHRTTLAMNDAARRLSRFLLTELAVNAVFGVLVACGLAAIGIPSPVMWGVLGALLRFVPYIGAPVSALVPLALAAAIDPGWSTLLWTASLYFVLEVILGQVIEPMVYGRGTGLSPFAVVVAATFWTWLWGPIGLILSTPLTVCLVVLGRHVPRLRFLEILLGDRPALTPVQSFYQRMLAADPDEVREQADILLRDLSLSSYYDEVALNGLRLATIDAERNAFSPTHLLRVKGAIQTLIEDLADHEDTSSGDRPAEADLLAAGDKSPLVLCVAGRGALDDEASAMLAQLLEKQGLASRVAPYAAIGRAAIGGLNVTDVTMVCICCLALSGNLSHLRYMMRRLRARLPRGVPVLVGFWPEDEEMLRDERLRAAVGADDYVSSLHQALDRCLNNPVVEAVSGAEPGAARTNDIQARSAP